MTAVTISDRIMLPESEQKKQPMSLEKMEADIYCTETHTKNRRLKIG